ncbi:hypothetical protein Anapl_07002 [Anas platyrhynchos]|uniref:Uncharacterized protein n=1 Tax=Anas platyrhynchos TaxID=8839 RepID=R0M325_ANAPL|nr:hypothetical protein Anapl_07002 [Anas platyrhynchos]
MGLTTTDERSHVPPRTTESHSTTVCKSCGTDGQAAATHQSRNPKNAVTMDLQRKQRNALWLLGCSTKSECSGRAGDHPELSTDFTVALIMRCTGIDVTSDSVFPQT